MSNHENTGGPPPNSSPRASATTLLRRDRKILIAVFVLMALALAITGYVYIRRQQDQAQIAANDRLAAIADLKLGQITNWRQERLSDARFFSRAPFVAADTERLLQNPSEANRAASLRWLKLLKGDDRYYQVAILDSQLRPLVAIPSQSFVPTASDRQLMSQILKDKEIAMGDLDQDAATGLIHLDILFPIYNDADRREGLLGFGYLKLDARQFLFHLIQSWPTASRTAETLLVRREGKEVVYLNDLRHQPGAAMRLRVPLASQVSSARVLQGDTNFIEGVDYRGIAVVAVGRQVPGTSWAMVAKVDREELYAPLRRQTLTASLVIGSLLLIGALVTALLWWQRGNEFLRHELTAERERLAERKAYEAELERMNRLYAALSQVNQTIVRARSRDELFQQVCKVLVEFGGFQMAWLGWKDPVTHQVLPVAHFGEHPEYVQEISIYSDDRPEGRSPIGMAIRLGEPCIFNDPQRVAMIYCHDAVERCGWRSIAAFPIRQEGKIVAALAVYSTDPNHFATKEKDLLVEAAGDVSFGIDLLLNDQRRQRAEEGLRALNAELEERVQQRTAQLEAKNRALESFTYSVSHDLKAPLRGIAGFSRVLIEEQLEKLGDSGQECVRNILHAAERMNQLIDDLLGYSRLEIQKPESSVVSPREMVEQILEDFAPQTLSAKTQVTVDIQGSPLRTDPQGLELALRNLIGNAIKFSAKTSQPLVQIIGRDKGDCFRLEVRDNGIGFDMQYKEKLFQIFQRLHRASDYPGTGIGLAIVRKAVERVGGTVCAQSEPGKGASFTLEIPRQQP